MVVSDAFEKLPGGTPYRLLDSHPDGKYIAMQTRGHSSGRSAVPLPRTFPLIATLPAGWSPIDPDAEEVLSIADPVFLDNEHVQVRLPSGEIQVHQVPVE